MSETERQRLEGVAEWFSTFDGVNGLIIDYTARYLSDLARGPAIAEMGCADGRMTQTLADRFERVTAIDASATQIDRAKDRMGARDNVTFVNTFFEAMPDDLGLFNTVIQAHILEHVEDPVATLKAGADLLIDEGILIAQVPHAMSLHRRIGVAMGLIKSVTGLSKADQKLGHRRVYTKKALVADATAAGLQVIDDGGFFIKPLSNAQMETWSPDLLSAFFEVGRTMKEYAAEIYLVLRRKQ